MNPDAALTADVSELYRFALLLTGTEEAAQAVLLETLAEVRGELTQFRNDRHRTKWFVVKVRDRALRRGSPGAAGAVSAGESFGATFARLPEPERSVLALFYLDFLPVREIAHMMKMKLETVSEHLKQGRADLQALLPKGEEGGA